MLDRYPIQGSRGSAYRPTSQELEDELVDILHVVMRIAERYRIDLDRAQWRARRRDLEERRAAGKLAEARSLAVDSVEDLSEREYEVLQLVAAGLSNREIAQRIVVAAGTVKRHVHNIYRKLGVRCRTQAVAQARVLGLLPS
ncbi:MAG: response regulator transcription factor [Dehalococcoidia bacterium]